MKKKKIIVTLSAALCMMLSSQICQAEETETFFTDGIVYGKNVFIEKEVIMIPSGQSLVTGLLDENGKIYDLIRELSVDEDLHTIAQDDKYLYIGTSRKLSRLDISGENTGTVQSELVIDRDMYDGFQIYDGFVYYPHISSVYRVPVTGGEESLVAENVEDYELTKDGIYFITEGGRFCRTDFEGNSTENLGDGFEDGHVTAFQNDLYLNNDSLSVFHLDTHELEDISLSHNLNDFYDVIPRNDYLLFTDEDYKIYKYEFSTGLETQIHTTSLPQKEARTFYKNMMYYSYGTGDMFTMSMGDYQSNKFSLEEQINGTTTSTNAGSNTGSADTTANDGYDISSGMYDNYSSGGAFMATDHICLYFNADHYLNGLWKWEVIDNTEIRFYYPRAAESGYGGTIVTIKAFDVGTTEYMDYPSYHVADTSTDKIYVAIYPTDVQFDPADSVQAAEYPALLEFAQRIDNCNEQNPFFAIKETY